MKGVQTVERCQHTTPQGRRGATVGSSYMCRGPVAAGWQVGLQYVLEALGCTRCTQYIVLVN